MIVCMYVGGKWLISVNCYVRLDNVQGGLPFLKSGIKLVKYRPV
jgi:hypothetical protein